MNFLDRFRSPRLPEQPTYEQPRHALQDAPTTREYEGKVINGAVTYSTFRARDEEHFIGHDTEVHHDATFITQAAFELTPGVELPDGMPSMRSMITAAWREIDKPKASYRLSQSGKQRHLAETPQHAFADVEQLRSQMEADGTRLFAVLDRHIARELHIHNEVVRRESELRAQLSDISAPIPGFDEIDTPHSAEPTPGDL